MILFWLTSDSKLSISYYYYIVPTLTFFYLYFKNKKNTIFCKNKRMFASQAAQEYYEAYEKLFLMCPIIIVLSSMIYIYGNRMIFLCVCIILVSIRKIYIWCLKQCSIIKYQKYYIQK
jgi:hypothetical protein